jgi:archaellum component FlaF (FlaF/FlaG flagellin family)
VPDVFQISRVFDQATETWRYAIFFSNPTQTELTVTQVWAGRDAIAPFNERVTIDGSGISISDDGIVFGTGSSGTIQFSTTQGHNIVTVITGNGARYTISWSEQL